MKKIMLIAVLALVAMAASAKDIKTVLLTTNPPMHCNSCETRIKENLKYVKGVKSIETDVASQTVKVTYDADKTTVQKFIDSLKKIQYTATEKEATPCTSAKESCQGQQGSCCEGGQSSCCGK